MRLITDLFQGMIDISEDYIRTIIIEKPTLMRSLLENLVSQIGGNEGAIILSDNNKELKISNYVELIDTYIPFEINNKRIVSKIMATLEMEALNEENYHRTREILSDVERHLDKLSEILPCEIEYENLAPAALIKAAGVKISVDSKTCLEMIIDYMELIRDIDKKEKLFVFLNLRSFFEDDEIEIFFETCIAHKFMIVCLEGYEKTKLNFEKRIIIDKDLCII